MANGTKQKPPGRPRKIIESIDLTGLADSWDNNDEIRERLRGGGELVVSDASKGESIAMCVKDQAVLMPLLAMMSLKETRPLPLIEPLRAEVERVYIKNKRGSDTELGATVVALAWHIRRLLGFIKMKVRRSEVSIVPLF